MRLLCFNKLDLILRTPPTGRANARPMTGSVAVSKDGLQYRFVIPGTRDAMAEPAALSEVDASTAGLAVSLRGVTKVYDRGVMALGPLDLDVRKGEFVSLLGPSGFGKSTALRLIAGLNAPTSGSVGISKPAGQARPGHSIGFVFQEPTLMPWTSVRENVRLPLKLAQAPAIEASARIAEALVEVGLTEFADAFPGDLSDGMKMRVSLARALVTDPDILL